MIDRSEVLTGRNPAGDARLLAAYGQTPRVTPARAEDVIDPSRAADLEVTPDPFDGGCPADCHTPPGRLAGDTDGRMDAALYLWLVGEDGAADAVVAEAARRDAARATTQTGGAA